MPPRNSEGAAGAAGPECVQANLDVYNSITDTWRSLTPMPTMRGGLSLAAVLTGLSAPMLYAVGGFHCTNGPAHTESLVSHLLIDC